MKELRLIVTGVMWIAYLIFLWLALSEIGAWVALLAFVLMIPLMIISSLLFRERGDDPMTMSFSVFSKKDIEAQEKRKRERIDRVLRDMSTEDLEVLKQRLADGLIDDAILEERIVGIGDDGELITKSDRDY
ncbi:MAG: hypothetical protein AAFR81_22345 [Chloroflexota bacterium]